MTLDPRVSLLALALFFLLILLSPNLGIQLAFILFFISCYLHLTSLRQTVKICVFLLFPTVMILALNWFFVSQEFHHLWLMILRFWGLTWLFNWFLKQVGPDDLARALWAFHVPYSVAWQVSLAYRFLPMFQEESQRIYQIQVSRGIPLDGNFFQKMRYIPSLSIPLLVMTQDKAELFAEALYARNWNIRTPKTVLYPLEMHLRDWLLLGGVLAISIETVKLIINIIR